MRLTFRRMLRGRVFRVRLVTFLLRLAVSIVVLRDVLVYFCER